MNRIKITLTNYKLQVINKVWEGLSKNGLKTPEDKVMFDITSKVATKLKKKFIEKEFNDSTFSFKLEYNEAYFFNKALERYANTLDFTAASYECTVLLQQINYLNQKLA